MKELPKNAGETREIDRRTILKGLGIGAATAAGIGAGLWLNRLNNGANSYTPGAADNETTGTSSDRETTANHELSGDSMKLSAEEREKITDDAKQSALAKVNELRDQTPSDVFDDKGCHYASADYYSPGGMPGLGRQYGEYLFIAVSEDFYDRTQFEIYYSDNRLTANNSDEQKGASLKFRTDSQLADKNWISYTELVHALTNDETTALVEASYFEAETTYNSQGGYVGTETYTGTIIKIDDDSIMECEFDGRRAGANEGRQAREAITSVIDKFK